MKGVPGWLWVALLLLVVLHNDWWLWADRGLMAGLPVGLTYHLVYTAATVLVMLLVVKFAWPDELEDTPEAER